MSLIEEIFEARGVSLSEYNFNNILNRVRVGIEASIKMISNSFLPNEPISAYDLHLHLDFSKEFFFVKQGSAIKFVQKTPIYKTKLKDLKGKAKTINFYFGFSINENSILGMYLGPGEANFPNSTQQDSSILVFFQDNLPPVKIINYLNSEKFRRVLEHEFVHALDIINPKKISSEHGSDESLIEYHNSPHEIKSNLRTMITGAKQYVQDGVEVGDSNKEIIKGILSMSSEWFNMKFYLSDKNKNYIFKALSTEIDDERERIELRMEKEKKYRR